MQNKVKWFCLAGTLLVALLLRLPGIGWGLPLATPQVVASGLRCSYAFDEDQILKGVAKADVRRLDFDPHDYHWGTLHLELVLLALDGAQAAGVFNSPWRTAYYNLQEPDFTRVYVVGRLVAVATALLTIGLLFLFEDTWTGAFAAILVAVSPSHLLQSDQVRVDVTMTALLVLTLLVGVRAQRSGRPRQFFFLGIAAGLAIAGKYSAVAPVAAIALVALGLCRFPRGGGSAVAGGTLAGFLAGSPYFLIKPLSFLSVIYGHVIVRHPIPERFQVPAGRLLELHAANLIRFSMGLPAFLLALVGIVWMLRRRSPSDWMILAAVVSYVAILVPLRHPLIRYDLPLAMLLGLCAGIALQQFPRHLAYPLAVAALAMPLAGSIAQIDYMRSPAPANLALQRILEVVPPGTTISRLFREEPPLDQKVYPMGQNVLTDDLSKDPPAWVLTMSLPDPPPLPSTVSLLRSSYDEVAHFESRRILAWGTLGEVGAPHDWKYTHPAFTLYRRRAQ
jgi:hypothetical protein